MRQRLYLRMDGGALQSGEFRVTERIDGSPVYTICCPHCGVPSELPDTHSVHRSGAVSLIWSCPDSACPYAEYLQLEEVCR